MSNTIHERTKHITAPMTRALTALVMGEGLLALLIEEIKGGSAVVSRDDISTKLNTLLTVLRKGTQP